MGLAQARPNKTVCALTFAGFIFREFAIFAFFAFAGCSGVEIFAGEIFADIRIESVCHDSIIGVSLSEPHTDKFRFCRVYTYIY